MGSPDGRNHPSENDEGDDGDDGHHERHERHKQPVTRRRPTLLRGMPLQQREVPDVGLPREIEQVPEQRHRADHRIDRHIEHHPEEHDARHANIARLPQDRHGKER